MLKTGRHRHVQGGMSLVELMVGIVVGLFVVAASSLLVSGQMVENRRLVAEVQLQQDLRASMDIVVRELRRAGMHPAPQNLVWNPALVSDPDSNVFSQAVSITELGVDAFQVEFTYLDGTTGVTNPNLGFRLNTETGAIESLARGAGWQELTDRNAIEVLAFTVEQVATGETLVICPTECATGGTDCWPRIQSRQLAITVRARSRLAPEVVRSQVAMVRPRNDRVEFSDPAAPRMCP